MPIDITLVHTLVFYVLYATAGAGTYVIIERLIVYSLSARDARQLQLALANYRAGSPISPSLLDRGTAPAQLLKTMLTAQPRLVKRHALEDFGEAQYIDARAKLSRNVWILDTMVTAAPLLGLLGTILGIIETFSALAQSGISDPAAVSRGIGTALYATALGISVALYGLVFFNHFQMRQDAICEMMKALLLRAGMEDADRRAGHVSEVEAELATAA
jgi:biopolymer transport protein ExbB